MTDPAPAQGVEKLVDFLVEITRLSSSVSDDQPWHRSESLVVTFGDLRQSLVALTASPVRSEAGETRWRHKKRGSTYVEVGRAHLQSSDATGLIDGQPMVVYRGEEDHQLWVRPTDEFEDGRFERASPPRAQPSPQDAELIEDLAREAGHIGETAYGKIAANLMAKAAVRLSSLSATAPGE